MIAEQKNIPVDIEDEMRTSYLDYAMSVIIGRALPDVRDGLKPVHRRILFGMHELGLSWNRPYKKSARIVGEVLGKYHPHGDTALYDSITRMVQDFSMRIPLIDGQGNFGSVDGDSPAAMRYTEIRLARISENMLMDLDKDTVDFVPNFDGSLTEPVVLPARIPNLLVNGSAGIAVGMSTNIPPHNLGEVIDALIHMIDHPGADIDTIMEHIKGPDFPTGAFIYGKEGIIDAYRTGRGIIQIRARCEVEIEEKKERESIIVKELPYQVNKSRLIEKIADLVNEGKLEGIHDIRDESDREGMRIVMEVKKNKIAKVIMNQLYKHTQMQVSFGIIMLALVNNKPKILNIKSLLTLFLEHRREIVTRRTRFELKEAKEKAHILEGLKIAIDNIDEVVNLIRSSASPEEAKEKLTSNFNLSEIQANAILNMRLQRLTGLEREKIERDLEALYSLIKELESILASNELLMNVIKKELLEIKKTYDKPRLSKIIPHEDEIDYEDMIQDKDVVVVITHRGYAKTTSLDNYRIQKRRGYGVKGVTTVEEDFPEHIFVTTTHHYIFFFTDSGRFYWLKVYDIPEVMRQSKGKPLVNLLPISNDERITAIFTFKEFDEGHYLIMATKKGKVKKSKVSEYQTSRGLCMQGTIGIELEEEDRLISVKMTDGNKHIILGTRKGKAIHFNETEIRPMGRRCQGVRGINLDTDDEVVDMQTVVEGDSLLTVTEKGYGKLSSLSLYRLQKRSGKGLKNIHIKKEKGLVVGIKIVGETDTIMLITSSGNVIWVPVKGIRSLGRYTQGVKLVALDEDDRVVGVACLEERPETGDEKE
ncbi:MAG: DNA gyrase subunit A [bacterium]